MNLLSSGRTPLVVSIHVELVRDTLVPNHTNIPRGTPVIVAKLKTSSKTNKMTLLNPYTENTDSLRREFEESAYYGIVASNTLLSVRSDDNGFIQTNCVVPISVANVDMMKFTQDTSDESANVGSIVQLAKNTVSIAKPRFFATLLTKPMGPTDASTAQVYFTFQPCKLENTGTVGTTFVDAPQQSIGASMVDVAPGVTGASYVDIAKSCAQVGAAAATKINGGATPLGPHSSTEENLTHGFCNVTSDHIEAEPNSLAAALLYSHANATEKDAQHIRLRHELVINRKIPKEVAGAVNKHTGKPLKKFLAHPGVFDCEGAYGKNPCVWSNPAHGACFAKKYAEVVRHAFTQRKAFNVAECHDLIAHLATPVV